MATPTNIETAAKACIASYAAAMHLAHSTPPTPVPTVASALSAHYLSNFTSFTLGTITPMPDNAVSTAMILGHLEHLVSSGVGCDVRMVESRIEAVQRGSALCWITWTIVPAEGWNGEGWEWENCYFFRRLGDGKVGWEGVISDGEIEGMVGHIPGFFG